MNRSPSTIATIGSLLVRLALISGMGLQQGIAGQLFQPTGCRQGCPACNFVCRLQAEVVDEEQTCFEVETEVICIPRVVFPWQARADRQGRGPCLGCERCGGHAGPQHGSRLRTIKVLRTKTVTCPRCKYTWTAKPPNSGRRGQASETAFRGPLDPALASLRSRVHSEASEGDDAGPLGMVEVEYLDE